MSIKDSIVVHEALTAFESLKYGEHHATSLHPKLLKDVLSTSIDCPEKPKDFNFNVCHCHTTPLFDKICLTSGGADSTIAWFLADKPQGMYIDICQGYNRKEKEALRNIGINFIDIDLTYLGMKNGTEKDWKHIIPGRNFLFLTIAAELLKDKGIIIFAVTEGEGWNSGKGDKSEKFLKQWQKWYEAVTGKRIEVDTLVSNTKAGWLKEFKQAGHDIDIIRYKTVTCFSQGDGQCGKCQACLRKYLSFISAFGLDTFKDYTIHPVIGCIEYINKYKTNLKQCLATGDFTHYSNKRCHEDLYAIHVAEEVIKK